MMFLLLKIIYSLLILFFLYFFLSTNTSQRRLLSMIFVLINFACMLLFLHFEYVAFIIVILYIGAISVLFLFLIMFINNVRNLKKKEMSELFLLFYFLGIFFLVIGICLFNFSLTVHTSYLFENFFYLGKMEIFYFLGYNSIFSTSFLNFFNIVYFFSSLEIEQLGFLFWTSYGFLVILSSFVLIVSIFGSVSLLKGIFIFNMYKKNFLSSNLKLKE